MLEAFQQRSRPCNKTESGAPRKCLNLDCGDPEVIATTAVQVAVALRPDKFSRSAVFLLKGACVVGACGSVPCGAGLF